MYNNVSLTPFKQPSDLDLQGSFRDAFNIPPSITTLRCLSRRRKSKLIVYWLKVLPVVLDPPPPEPGC